MGGNDFLIFDDSSSDKDKTASNNDNLQPTQVHTVTQRKVQLSSLNDLANIVDGPYKNLKEDDLIQFQQTLNKRLESLLYMMKNTEYSRHLLAKHSQSSFKSSQNCLVRSSGTSFHDTMKPKREKSIEPCLPPLRIFNHDTSPIDTKSSICSPREKCRKYEKLSKVNFDTKKANTLPRKKRRESQNPSNCKKRYQTKNPCKKNYIMSPLNHIMSPLKDKQHTT